MGDGDIRQALSGDKACAWFQEGRRRLRMYSVVWTTRTCFSMMPSSGCVLTNSQPSPPS